VAKPSAQYAGNSELGALGAAIRRARESVALSQEALAHDAEIDRSYLGGIERGEHNITTMNLIKICRTLKLKPSVLMAEAGL